MASEDSRFDEAEAEIARGNPWRYREDGAVNPLTILATGWSSGHTLHGEAEFLTGVDRAGTDWTVLVGPTVLRKRLIDGEVSEWDDDRGAFVVVRTEGRVQPGEVVSIRYAGDKPSSTGGEYASFDVVRKPPPGDQPKLDAPEDPSEPAGDGTQEEVSTDDDIPF